MKTKVEALQDNQVKLTVTIDAKEIDDRIKKTYKDFAHKYNFPGFRRGKAPRPVIDNALGAEAVLASVTDDVLKEDYPLAVDESGIYPISKPNFEDTNTLVQAGKTFDFIVSVTNKPEFELSSYDPAEIELPAEGASEEEIQAQIDSLREHYFSFEDAAASAKIEEDGTADIAMKAFDANNEPLDSLTFESRMYTLGSGFYPAEFDVELLGLKKGEKKSFDLEFKGLYTAGLAAIAGQVEKAHFELEVKVVKKKLLPEPTEEWAKDTLGFESLEDLKTRMSESIIKNKEEAIPHIKEAECLHVLSERLQGDIPSSMVDSAEADLVRNFFQQLQAQGMNLDLYLMQQNISFDKFKEELKQQALDLTKQDLALDAWARTKGIKVTEEDILEEFANSGAEDPKALEKEWRSNGQLHVLRQGVLRMRAIKEVMDTAKVSEIDLKRAKEKEASRKAEAEAKEAKAKEAKAKEAKASSKKAAAKKASAKDDASVAEKPVATKPSSVKKTSAKKPSDKE